MASLSAASLLSLLQAYPELLLSLASFLLLRYYPRWKSSSSPINWPVIGMLPTVVANFHHVHDYITDLLRESGSWTWMFHGPWGLDMNMLLTSDPANVNYVLSSNIANYHKGDKFNEVFDIFGDGLFNTDADSWKLQRKIANVYIGDRFYRSFVAAATRDKAERTLLPILRRACEQGEAVELQDLFMRLAFDVTSRIVFGADPGCLAIGRPSNVPFSVAIDDAWEALLFRHAVPQCLWRAMRWLNVGKEKKLAKARKVIDQYIAKQIADRRAELEAKKSDDVVGLKTAKTEVPRMNDILTSYIANVVDDIKDKYVPDKFLRDNALTFMIAGRDGFAICLSWLFWLLARNPKAEAKIMEELAVHRAVENESESFDAEEIGRMVYLHGAVCEALRLFPPVPYEEKTAIEEDVLPSGTKVAPGCKILMCAYAMGRMESIWGEDCVEFKPERWIDQYGRLKHVPAYKFMAFNAGPRICPGRDIALTQIKTVAAAVMWNFEVDIVEDDRVVVAPKNAVMIRMQNGMMAKIRKRSTSPRVAA